MMNSTFTYRNIELWDETAWSDKISEIFNLVTWLGENEQIDRTPYSQPVDGLVGDQCKTLTCYAPKTNSVNIPAIVDGWKGKGVHYECRSQGGINWIIMAPVTCLKDFGKKLPTVVVMHQADIEDPYWAMKALDRFAPYNEMVASSQNSIVVYIIAGTPDTDRIYVNILQEAFVFVPGDVEKVLLDVSTVYSSGHTLGDIPKTIFRDGKGNKSANPDKLVANFGSANIPVLDITHKWENKCSLSRDQVSKENWSTNGFDLERIIHSEAGKRFAEGMVLEYRFDTTYDPGFLKYWQDMGLKYENRETKMRRWKAAVPLSAYEDTGMKLPVICVMQEVNHSNEHLAVTAASYFHEYFRIAAQGECMLICFVLEDADSNDLLCEILDEARALYPMMDSSRVYLAGHSHNGYYALEFAVRHSERVAAVATFGDIPGLHSSALFRIDEAKIERMRQLDLPVVNLAGCKEPKRHFPLSSDGGEYRQGHMSNALTSFKERAESWQLRLKAFDCPMKSLEEIAATRNSPEKAIRELGIPGDNSETLWLDGFELYIVDIKNNKGKYHLRMVGEENMPHNTTPAQQDISWSFMKRFARDAVTGKIIDLY